MLVNGHPQDSMPLADRAIHYGDGAFETVLVSESRLVHWSRHMARLKRACDFLKIPLNTQLIELDVRSLLKQSQGSCIIKIMVTRGAGGRGYMPPEHPLPTRIVTVHTLPSAYADLSQRGVCVVRCKHPVSENAALAGMKHLNRLDQVLASMELPVDCQEGLMCNSRGLLIEGTKSNVFLARSGTLMTPLLDRSGVAGIQREVILEYCSQNQLQVAVREIPFAEAVEADEIFMCNSVFGIWPVTELRCEGTVHHLSIGPFARMLQNAMTEHAPDHG